MPADALTFSLYSSQLILAERFCSVICSRCCQYLTSWCKWIDRTRSRATTVVRRHKVMSFQLSSRNSTILASYSYLVIQSLLRASKRRDAKARRASLPAPRRKTPLGMKVPGRSLRTPRARHPGHPSHTPGAPFDRTFSICADRCLRFLRETKKGRILGGMSTGFLVDA